VRTKTAGIALPEAVGDETRGVPFTRRSAVVMGTIVTIDVPPPAHADAADPAGIAAALDRAFAWFHDVESRCTRFDPASELMQACATVGRPAPVGSLLFEALQFALAVAEASGGAFDPTVGAALHTRGFNREHRTGRAVDVRIESSSPVSYRDVELDNGARTVTLHRPLILDLGAVAKGLAIDLAARELAPWRNFAIDAGGDLYLGGSNGHGEPWAVGIRHPRRPDEHIATVRVSDMAVCTSGDYERTAPGGDGHHLIDPRSGASPDAVASATVVAPTALAADALATAAFVLGPEQGIRFLESQGVQGIVITSAIGRHATRGWTGTSGPGPAGPGCVP
jgi:thiamine biosynthesis lipoprotein